MCVRCAVSFRFRFFFCFFGNDADVDAGDANEPPFSEVVAVLAGVACGCVYASECVCVRMCDDANAQAAQRMLPGSDAGREKCCQTHFIIYAARVR